MRLNVLVEFLPDYTPDAERKKVEVSIEVSTGATVDDLKNKVCILCCDMYHMIIKRADMIVKDANKKQLKYWEKLNQECTNYHVEIGNRSCHLFTKATQSNLAHGYNQHNKRMRI